LSGLPRYVPVLHLHSRVALADRDRARDDVSCAVVPPIRTGPVDLVAVTGPVTVAARQRALGVIGPAVWVASRSLAATTCCLDFTIHVPRSG
jgi:hypothetical protein